MSREKEENDFLSSFSVKGCVPNDNETKKIPPKDPGSAFLINFKDSSGAFLNGLQSQSQPGTSQSKLSSLGQSFTENVAGNFCKDQNTFDSKQIIHDHDYTKKSGPEKFHTDKGNILLTINLTEYSKMIDIRRIRGVVLLLDDQPPQRSEGNVNTNSSESVSRPDLINRTCSTMESISISEYGYLQEDDASGSANGPDLVCKSGLNRMHEYGSVDESTSLNNSKKVSDSDLLTQNTSVNEKGEKEFKCPRCEKIYYAPRLLQKHYKKEHDSSYKYKCPRCPQVYKTSNVLKNHIRREHFTRCEFCDDTFETIPTYKTHLKEIHKKVNYNLYKPYFCEPCDTEFTSKDIYLKHLRGHGGFRCNICAERFDSKAELTTHEEIHPNKYVCEICNKGFKEKCSLKAHETVHNDLSFFCHICKQGFKAKGGLRHHIMQKHIKNREFMCDKCPGMFFTRSRLLHHQKTVHDHIKEFGCPDCSRKFTSASNVAIHQSVIHLKLKPHQCEFCGKQFAKKDGLVNHRYIHTGTPRRPSRYKPVSQNPDQRRPKRRKPAPKPTVINPVDCGICGRTLKNVTYLKIHLNTHARIRKFKCSFCGLMFLHQTSKIRHEKAHEADPENKFVCPICWKRTKTKEELNMHTKKHKIKKHKCEICGEAFSRMMLLDNHILLNHTNEEEIIKKQEIIMEGLRKAVPKL